MVKFKVMNIRENGLLRGYETYSGLDHLSSVAKFLENPEIVIIGVHISPYVKSYRIAGLQIKNVPTGIIIKKQDIPLVREHINNGAVIDSKTIKVIRNHLSVIGNAFTEAEKALRTKKT